ncbi:MAG: dihydroneopterin aldolase [Acidimicrobiales bacterium]
MLEQEGARIGGTERVAPGPDRILLQGMRFLGTHGALPEESQRPQPFEVDLELLLDLRAAGRTDDIGATVDYAELCEATRAVVEGPSVLLLERLAQQVAERALAVAGDRAEGVVVTVRKLRPPVPVELAAAAVRVYRP